MSEQQAPVLASVRNRIGHLTLNRPGALNTLDLPTVTLLCRHLRVWEQDPEIVAVTLRGAGEKAFCAGGDIRMLYDSHKAGDNLHERFLEEEYALDEYLHGYSKPVLALLDGFVLGGGMGLAQAASLRVITERTRMGMPEVGIGFFPMSAVAISCRASRVSWVSIWGSQAARYVPPMRSMPTSPITICPASGWPSWMVPSIT